MDGGYTFAELKTVVIEWKINNVWSFLNEEDGKTDGIESSIFSTGSKIGDQWRLKLFLNEGCSPDCLDGKTSISLRNESISNITAKIAFFILNSKQEKVLIEEYCETFLPEGGWISDIFEEKMLLSETPEFIIDDTLTFYCRITFNDETITISNDKVSKPDNYLANDLGKLYESKNSSDVTIIVESTKFQAHKLILIARSPVLAAMFTHDMIEKKSNEVFITDIDPEIFEKVLQFMYTDNIVDLSLDADRILEAADKYQIQSLKEFCEAELIKSLNGENVLKTVALADRHNAQNLKDYAIKCIIADANDVMKTSEYGELEKNSPSLALELLRKIVLANIDNEATMTLIN